MWPLPGRVYVTPSIGQALKYANWKEGRQVSDPEPWDGVVLDVVVPAGADVLPDEDCVGEAVGYAFGMDERSICGWDVADLFWSADSDKLFAELARVARPHLPFAPEVFESSPSLRMLVRAGKSVLPHLPDHLQRALIAHGANISVVPPVDVLGAWVVGGPAEDYRKPDEKMATAAYVLAGVPAGLWEGARRNHAEWSVSSDGSGVVAEVNGSAVGRMVFLDSVDDFNRAVLHTPHAPVLTPVAGKIGWLRYIELDESLRGKGTGTAIVQAMLAEARGNGVDAVVLHAVDPWSRNYAKQVNFWTKMGFEPVRYDDGLYSGPPMVRVL